jgi:hypothetical protein
MAVLDGGSAPGSDRNGKSADNFRLETAPGTPGNASVTPCGRVTADCALVYALQAEAAGLRGDGSTCGGYRRARQAGARAATSGPDAQGRRDSRRRVRSRPHRGGVRPGRPTAERRRRRVAAVTLARTFTGRGPSSGMMLRKASTGTAPVIRAAGVSLPRWCRPRRRQERRDHRRRIAAAYAPGKRTTGTGILRRRPGARTRRCGQRAGAAGHQCCRPAGSRSVTLRRVSDFPSAPHRSWMCVNFVVTGR